MTPSCVVLCTKLALLVDDLPELNRSVCVRLLMRQVLHSQGQKSGAFQVDLKERIVFNVFVPYSAFVQVSVLAHQIFIWESCDIYRQSSVCVKISSCNSLKLVLHHQLNYRYPIAYLANQPNDALESHNFCH